MLEFDSKEKGMENMGIEKECCQRYSILRSKITSLIHTFTHLAGGNPRYLLHLYEYLKGKIGLELLCHILDGNECPCGQLEEKIAKEQAIEWLHAQTEVENWSIRVDPINQKINPKDIPF